MKLGFGSLCTFGSLDANDAPANVVLVLFRWLQFVFGFSGIESGLTAVDSEDFGYDDIGGTR